MPRLLVRLALAPLALGLACASACDAAAPPSSAPSVAASELRPPSLDDFADPTWSPPSPAGALVARVGDVPITRAALDAHLAAHPEISPRQALDALVIREALAQQAMRQGLSQRPDVTESWRQALVQAWLDERFEAQHGPDRISREQVRRIYSVPSIRKLYDHEHAWRMVHLAIVCCNPRVGDCDRPHVAACFEDAARKLHAAYEELEPLARPLESDPEAVAQLLARYRAKVEPTMPELFWREVSFFYDPEKSHAEQRGYELTAEAVARAVIDGEEGVLLAPVQSTFGWHLIVKLAHEPRVRKGPDDPEVDADIRRNALEGVRQAWFLDAMKRLLQEHQVAMHPKALELLQPEAL